MPKRSQTRKKDFKAALAYAEMTVKQWCQENSVTPPHLHLVLTGQRESARLIAVVDEFIEKHSQSAAA